jgi:hypothetical protein
MRLSYYGSRSELLEEEIVTIEFRLMTVWPESFLYHPLTTMPKLSLCLKIADAVNSDLLTATATVREADKSSVLAIAEVSPAGPV